MTRSEIESRIAEIDAKIGAAQHWGALLTALSEERKALETNLKTLPPEQ